MVRRILILTTAVALLAGCAPPAQAPQPTPAAGGLRQIRLPMGFIPSVQFAAFYVAVDKGYFAAEGLALEFDYLFETNGVQLVGAGELPFAVVSGEQVLLARAQGLPVVYVAAWWQDFPVAIISKAELGLTQPHQLAGQRIGTPLLEGASYVGLHALLSAAGLPPEAVNIEVVGFNQVAALDAGQVEAAVVYSNNEPIRLRAQGEQLNVIAVSDYVALASNGILTNEDTLAREPELVRSFVRALVRGIADSLADPDEAYAIAARYVHDIADEAVERQVLDATLAMWQADRPGFAQPQAWDNMHAALLDAGLLAAPLEVSQAYTNEFVP
jgi:NitT/TauT family transport system substrate-binding protein